MVVQETFMTPSGLFFIGITSMCISTALLHPHEFHLIVYGFLYLISIPSGYLLLIIYSMVNMNNVSWGTREADAPAATAAPPSVTHQKNVKCQKLCRLCGYSVEIQVNEEVKVVSTAPPDVPLAATEAAVPSQQEDQYVFMAVSDF